MKTFCTILSLLFILLVMIFYKESETKAMCFYGIFAIISLIEAVYYGIIDKLK